MTLFEKPSASEESGDERARQISERARHLNMSEMKYSDVQRLVQQEDPKNILGFYNDYAFTSRLWIEIASITSKRAHQEIFIKAFMRLLHSDYETGFVHQTIGHDFRPVVNFETATAAAKEIMERVIKARGTKD